MARGQERGQPERAGAGPGHSLVPHITPEIGTVFMTGFLAAFDEKCVYDAMMLIGIAYLFFLGDLMHFLRPGEGKLSDTPIVP